MTYHFTGVVAWDVLGTSVRIAANKRSVSIIDPATLAIPTNLVQGGVAVSWITVDPRGRYSFQCDPPSVVVDFGAGPWDLAADEVPAMTAAFAISSDSATAAILGNPASASRAVTDPLYAAPTAAIAPTGGVRAVGKGELVVNLADYGAIGATDDAATVNAAIVAANTASDRSNGLGYKGVVILVPGRVNLPNGATQRITQDGIFFVSSAPGKAVITVQSGPCFTWGTGATGLMKSGGTRGIKFAGNAAGVDATQICHLIDYGAELSFNDTKIAKVGKFVRAGTGSTTTCSGLHITGLIGTAANVAVPLISLDYGAGAFIDAVKVYVDGVGFPSNTTETHASVGTAGTFSNGSGCGVIPGRDFIHLGVGSWDTVQLGGTVTTVRFDRSFAIEAATGAVVGNIYMSNPIFDYNATRAIHIVGTGGTITKVRVSGGYLVATDGHVLHIAGTGGLVEGFNFTDCNFLFAGQNSVRVDAGSTKHTSFTSCVSRGANRLAASNTGDLQDGVVMNGSDWQIIGGRHGLDGASYTGFVNQARYGLVVATSSDRYSLAGVVLDGASGAQVNMNGHTSNGLARSVSGVTTRAGTRLNGTTMAAYTIAATGANMTNFLGFTAIYYVSGGTVTVISVNGVTTGLTAGAFTLGPGDTWAITYTAAPTVNRQLLAA